MKKPLLFLAFSFLSTFIFAQNLTISYENPNDLSVCGQDQLKITLTNAGSSASQNPTVQLTLPTGLIYQIGSVAGASEQNIANLNQPIFSLTNIAGGGKSEFTLNLAADCKLVSEINSGKLFSFQIKANWQGGSEAITTNAFKIETGLVIVNSVIPNTLQGEAGDMFTRKISVTNTRQGKIGSLRLTDQHFPGLTMEVPTVGGTNSSPVFFTVEIPGSYFKNFGDGDEFFEFNETIEITEKITITDCGLPPFSNESKIVVGWGCAGDICQTDEGKGEVSILTSTKNPFLEFKTDYGYPLSYCGDAGSTHSIEIKNTGTTDATNVQIFIASPNPFLVGFDGNSITADGVKITPNLSNAGALIDCDLDMLKDMSFSVPLVPAGKTVVVKYQTFFCGQRCIQTMPPIDGNFFYNKTCPTTAFEVGNIRFYPDSIGAVVKSQVNFDIGVCLEDGQNYNFKYWVKTKRLSQTNNGFLVIKMNLPWGLNWDNSCVPTLDGKALFDSKITVIPNQKTEVKLVWQLPFSKDSVSGDFCMQNVCVDKSFYENDLPSVPKRGADFTVFPVEETCDPCVHKVQTETILAVDPDPTGDCGISSCDEYRLILNCGCGDQAHCNGNCVKGLIVAKFDTWRANVGLRDNNDDRQADSNAPADRSKIDLNRYLPGDTLHTNLSGVVEDQPVGGFKFRIFHESVLSDFGINGGDPFDLSSVKSIFPNYDSIKYLGGRVKFVIAGNAYTCPIAAGDRSDQHLVTIAHPNIRPYQKYDELLSMFHEFTIDPAAYAGSCLPVGIQKLQPGDSVVFDCDFKFLKNVVPVANAQPALMNFRTTACDFRKVYAWNFSNCAAKLSQFSGYIETIGAPVFSIKPCEKSFQTQPFFYKIRIARENMFPNEVRWLSKINNFEHTVPVGLSLASLNLKYFKMQENIDLFPAQAMPHSLGGGVLKMDFSQFFQKPIDEGWSAQVDGVFDPACDFIKPDTAITTVDFSYPNVLHKPDPFIFENLNQLGYYSNLPNLDLIPAKNEIETGSPSVAIDFNLKNLAVAPSQNTWVRVVTADGSLTDISIVKTPGGQPMVGIAGVFQLGQIGGFFDQSYQIRATNLACEPLLVNIIYGWDCQPVTAAGAATCAADTAQVLLKVLQPELELVVQDAPTSLTLCQPSDYFEIEIYNANEGTTFDVFSTLKLPDGLGIVASSCQIFYSPNSWTNIADPTELPGNVFQWDMEKVLPALATAGLPGVDKSPKNSFKIRFKVLAECGFVANAQPIFGTEGKQACGAIANTLRKPDEPIVLNGVAPIYDVDASLGYVSGTAATGCGDERELEVVLNLKGKPAAGDSIYIQLPSGIAYILNSYAAGTNAPTGQPKISGKNLQWAIPSSLGANSILKFKFKVKYDAAGDCSDQAIVLQTRQKTSGFCVSSQSNCDVFVATGEAILFFNAANPELILKNFKPKQASGGQIDFSADLANIGSDAAAAGSTVQFFIDKNKDGKVDAGDQLLLTSKIPNGIAAGDAANFSGNFTASTADLCNLIAFVPAKENCACADRTFPLDGWNLLHETKASCEVKPLNFGIAATAGFSYGWNPSTNLSPTNQSTTTFTPDAGVMAGDRLTFILTESSAGCTIEHQFEVQFAGELGVETPDQKICVGEKVVLEATPGGSYNWSGAGISSPSKQSQEVAPAATTTYFVTVTFAAGCTGSDAVTVEVFGKSETDLGEIKICKGQKATIFGKQEDKAGKYSQILKNGNGCDSTLFIELKILETETLEEKSFCEGGSVEVFDSVFTNSGSLCRTFQNSLGCDSTHCVQVKKTPAFDLTDPVRDTLILGEGKQISLPAGFASYVWEPATGLSCSNCPNPTLTADTAGVYNYKVVVTNAGGCTDSLIYRAVAFPPCDPSRLPIPTAFTPNGDQVNDVFRVVQYEGLERVTSLEIWNRWGNKVFAGSGASAVWDGTLDGKLAPMDTYLYILKVSCPVGGEQEPRVGDVTVLR